MTRDPRKSEPAPVAEPAVLKTPPVSATAPRSSKIEAPPGAAAAVDDAIKIVVLKSGLEKFFCAGSDIKIFGSNTTDLTKINGNNNGNGKDEDVKIPGIPVKL